MHRGLVLVLINVLLAGSLAAGQETRSSAGASNSDPSASPLTRTGVAPDDVVISIDGFCNHDLLVEGTIGTKSQNTTSKSGSAEAGSTSESAGTPNVADTKGEECKTEITRAQFERLADALGIGDDASNRIRVAVRYPEILLYAQKARELEVQKDARFQEKLKYTYLQLLWQAFEEELARKANAISDAEVEKQYRQRPEMFEEVDLLRIFVPNEKKHSVFPASSEKVDALHASDAAAMKIEAEQIRKKAVAGGDFEKLEAEVYKFAGYDLSDAPDVDLGMTSRAEMPREYTQAVFDLKPGQVSELVPAPLGWHIVKVRSRHTIPLNEAKRLLQRLRLQEAQDSAKSSIKTDFNNAYFNTPHGMDKANATGGGAD
jgi:hypothetical protein